MIAFKRVYKESEVIGRERVGVGRSKCKVVKWLSEEVSVWPKVESSSVVLTAMEVDSTAVVGNFDDGEGHYILTFTPRGHYAYRVKNI